MSTTWDVQFAITLHRENSQKRNTDTWQIFEHFASKRTEIIHQLSNYLQADFLTYTPETQNVHVESHSGVSVELNHLPAPLHRQQLQLACVLSTAASVQDTEHFIALS